MFPLWTGGVHDLCIWSLGGQADILSSHLVKFLGRPSGAILQAASYICHSEYLLIHVNQPMVFIDVRQGAS